MVAQISGYKIGKFTHVVNNLHIYDKHLETSKRLRMETVTLEAPILWINPDVDDFYSFTEDDIKLIDYKYKNDIKNIDIAI